ncbi:hypothetical protein HOLleu_05924 [Holothuria leucospilota]|uniref:Uncharacterized protein n=1 Tax=Holothuria leucospilota TaxID=206669 RepID=A0A9Q1HIK4_HOLLE|nr:hypothetical protein HOLleu_05924 [Holothuria leucospilota]
MDLELDYNEEDIGIPQSLPSPSGEGTHGTQVTIEVDLKQTQVQIQKICDKVNLDMPEGKGTVKRKLEEDNYKNPSKTPRKEFDLEEELESLLEFTEDNQAPNQTENNATSESISEENSEGDTIFLKD